MFNLFFGFSGRLRRRDFILWSIAVPLVLILPPAIGAASMAQSIETTLIQDLQSSGALWPFLGLIVLMSYISVALFWKRTNDVDEGLQRNSGAPAMRWGYALLTALNTALVCMNAAALGELQGSVAGWILSGFWVLACWNRPHQGPNSFGPDPRLPTPYDGGQDAASPSAMNLDAAMQRALAERNVQTSSAFSPKLARAVNPQAGAAGGRPSFGKRG